MPGIRLHAGGCKSEQNRPPYPTGGPCLMHSNRQSLCHSLPHMILEKALGAVRADISLISSPFSERPLRVSKSAALGLQPSMCCFYTPCVLPNRPGPSSTAKGGCPGSEGLRVSLRALGPAFGLSLQPCPRSLCPAAGGGGCQGPRAVPCTLRASDVICN